VAIELKKKNIGNNVDMTTNRTYHNCKIKKILYYNKTKDV